MYGISAATTLITVSVVGGLPFIVVAALLGFLYYNGEPVSLRVFYTFLCNLSSRQGIRPNFSRYEKIGYDNTFSASHVVIELPFCTDSVTRSPLYSIYGETIAGVTILRAFGASSKFLRDMLRCVDTVSSVPKTSAPPIS